MILEMTSTTPLLMHNVRLSDPQDPYVKARQAILGKRSKDRTDEDQLEVDRLTFAGGLYFDDKLGPYLPAANIFACLIEAGRKTRKGKTVEGATIFLSDKAELNYDGPRTIEELWGGGDSPFVDRRMVVVNRQKIPGIRPVFPEWTAQIEIELDTKVLDEDEFGEIAWRAGRAVGVGDYRRFYGRFEGKVRP